MFCHKCIRAGYVCGTKVHGKVQEKWVPKDPQTPVLNETVETRVTPKAMVPEQASKKEEGWQ